MKLEQITEKDFYLLLNNSNYEFKKQNGKLDFNLGCYVTKYLGVNTKINLEIHLYPEAVLYVDSNNHEVTVPDTYYYFKY